MRKIAEIPLQELLDDKAASQADVKVCEFALLYNIQEYSKGRVRERLVTNQEIITVIDSELARREAI